MNYIETDGKFVLRFVKGDTFIENLIKFLEERKIEFSSFQGIGAALKVEIAFYSLKDKEYHPKTFEGEFEITGLIGNSSMNEGKPIIHAHTTIADETFNAYGGHVMEIIVAGALEIVLTPLSAKPERKFDEETGLKLLDI